MQNDTSTTLKVATLVCPDVFMPDIIGGQTVFGMVPNTETYLVWKNLEQFNAMPNWPMCATSTFETCPNVDVLIVGATSPEVVSDPEVLAFVKQQAKHASIVIGICAGTLLLGAAGLLKDKKARTNFQMMDTLEELGAHPVVGQGVLIDGKFYTAGPVSGSYEAALLALATLRGEEIAQIMELTLEYDPKPPFGVGSPELAGKVLTEKTMLLHKAWADAQKENAKKAYCLLT
jgi:transcriptional regulator GlxA family with amidase domain